MRVSVLSPVCRGMLWRKRASGHRNGSVGVRFQVDFDYGRGYRVSYLYCSELGSFTHILATIYMCSNRFDIFQRSVGKE